MLKTRITTILLICSFITFLFRCNDTPYPKGKALYEANCANCHQPDGSGLRQLYPPLAQSDFLVKHREEMPCIIRNGMNGEIEVNGVMYHQLMKPYPDMEDGDITNIINYIYNSWGNPGGFISPDEVKQSLDSCKSKY